jgi:hypothetical protein
MLLLQLLLLMMMNDGNTCWHTCWKALPGTVMFHLYISGTPGHTSQSAMRPRSTLTLSGRSSCRRHPVPALAKLAGVAALLRSCRVLGSPAMKKFCGLSIINHVLAGAMPDIDRWPVIELPMERYTRFCVVERIL